MTLPTLRLPTNLITYPLIWYKGFPSDRHCLPNGGSLALWVGRFRGTGTPACPSRLLGTPRKLRGTYVCSRQMIFFRIGG